MISGDFLRVFEFDFNDDCGRFIGFQGSVGPCLRRNDLRATLLFPEKLRWNHGFHARACVTAPRRFDSWFHPLIVIYKVTVKLTAIECVI